MPFTRPTLSALKARVQGDIDARLPGADSRLRRSNLEVLASALSGQAHGLYGYLGFIARQVLPDTAEAEFMERWAGVWGLARKAAAFSGGAVDLSGANGAVVPAGTELQVPGGAAYLTDAEAVLAAGVAQVAVTAAAPGEAGNQDPGATLSFVTPIAGVNALATVAAGGLVGGADSESDAALRARLLARIRQAPHGGADFDYLAWALEVPEVTRAWVFPNELGLGTVTLRFTLDDHAVSIIPDGAKVAEVQAYIEARRPVTAAVTVVAPVAVPLDLTIQLVPDTAAVRAAVIAELTDLLTREAVPGGTILLSHLREAISVAAGEIDHVLTVPAANVAHAAGELAVMGVVTWV